MMKNLLAKLIFSAYSRGSLVDLAFFPRRKLSTRRDGLTGAPGSKLSKKCAKGLRVRGY
jgi:hypothetical protein